MPFVLQSFTYTFMSAGSKDNGNNENYKKNQLAPNLS